MTFEELRKFNPLIFIKGGSESTTQKKSKQEVDLLNSLMRDHLVKDYFKDLAQMPNTQKIVINKQILEMFVKSITRELEEQASSQLVLAQIGTPNSQSYSKDQESVTNLDAKSDHSVHSANEAFQNYKCQEDKDVGTPKTIEVFKDRFDKFKFFEEQKKQWLNPKGESDAQSRFFKTLHQNHSQIMPVFNKLKQGVFDLTNYRLEPKILDALSTYVADVIDEQRSQDVDQNDLQYVKHIQFDSNDMRDAQFAKILDSVKGQNELQTILYSKNEFKEKSLSSLESVMRNKTEVDKSLQVLHLRGVKTNQLIVEKLLTLLEEFCNIRKIKLQQIDLNRA